MNKIKNRIFALKTPSLIFEIVLIFVSEFSQRLNQYQNIYTYGDWEQTQFSQQVWIFRVLDFRN